MRWQPIHPSDSPANTGLGEIAPVQLQERDPYTGLSLSCYNFTLSTMISLKFPFGNTQGKADAHYFLLEIACYQSGIHSVTYEDGRVDFMRKGIGIRVGIACWDVSFEAASNLAAVAASVAIKGAKSQMVVQALGGEAIEKLNAFKQLKLLSGLTPEAMSVIGSASGEVVDLFVKDPNIEPVDLRIAPLGVGAAGQVAAALSMQFANEQVYRGNNINRALELFTKRASDNERKYFHPVVARAVYAAYGIRDVDNPSQNQRDEARRILLLGR